MWGRGWVKRRWIVKGREEREERVKSKMKQVVFGFGDEHFFHGVCMWEGGILKRCYW